MIGFTVLLLALGLAGFVLAPLWRRDAAEAERVGAAVSEERDLGSRRAMLLAALRDLEEDHAAGKVDAGDFAELHARMSAEAVEIMRQLDALDEARRTSAPVGVPAPRPPGSGSSA